MTYFAEWAWLPDGWAHDVRIVVENSRFVEVVPAGRIQPGDERLRGAVLPGLANTHSHAFHRALRGRTHADGGTFWTWRAAMYTVAARLTPENYHALARAVFAEMVQAGFTGVGEFHYVHHRPGGASYADPNAMGHALIAAAAEARIRISLLDTCYLAGGLGAHGPVPLAPEQLRFADADDEAWATRHLELRRDAPPGVAVGAAIHSVRAVPRAALPVVVAAADGGPLHVHLSERSAENEQCRAAYGLSPTALLEEAGGLGPFTTAVHATHLDEDALERLARTRTSISVCPTTERDLADGIGPARRLLAAGSPLSLGTDQNAVIDPFEEARGLEMDERLARRRRGVFRPDELLTALTDHRPLGHSDAGRIEVGARADLVAVRLDSVRTAGVDPTQLVYAATAADVDTVMVDGALVVRAGRHLHLDVAAELVAAISAVSSRS